MSKKIQSQENRDFWQTQEARAAGQCLALSEVLERLRWNDQGLVPAIAQQHDSGEVLMLAWMNRAALEQTLSSGWVSYWSRSRGRLWTKGETSGQRQRLKSLAIDCDGDALLLGVDQQGPACHTARRSCFYFRVEDGTVTVASAPLLDPASLYPGGRKTS